jgi:hypothetical protein
MKTYLVDRLLLIQKSAGALDATSQKEFYQVVNNLAFYFLNILSMELSDSETSKNTLSC